jgi:4-amino-4-deoxy-L-arabinose transferase-like glycosyltransferase
MTRIQGAIVLFLLVLLFAGLGRFPLLDPDEGRYARTSQEMMERDDYIVPYFNGEPRLKKPVLIYWLEIGAFLLLGFTETAARLPSALAALGTLIWLFFFARKRAGPQVALMATLILGTIPLFFALARTNTIDMVLTFLVFGATVSLYAGVVEPAGSRWHLVIAGLCLGLGLLAKGPVALLVPTMAIPVAALARKREPITIAGKLVGSAWIMVAVALPWAVLLFQRVGMEEVLAIWRREALERFSGGLDHPESFFYLFLTAPITFFPWSALAPFAIYQTWKHRKPGDGLSALLLAWTAGGFLFFSLGRGKLDSYLLPLAPAAALLISIRLADLSRSQLLIRWGGWNFGFMAMGFLLPFPVSRLVDGTPTLMPILALSLSAVCLITCLLAYLKKERVVPLFLGVMMGTALLGAALLTPLDWAGNRNTRELVAEAKLGSSPGHLYVLRIRPPSLSFYTRRVPIYVPARYMLIRMVNGDEPASVVLEKKRREVIRQLHERGFRIAAEEGPFIAMRREGDG